MSDSPILQLPPGEAEGLVIFTAAMVALVVFDARLHRGGGRIALQRAVLLTVAWVALAVVFGLFIWVWRGQSAGIEFFTAYLLEQSLSLDNVFVFGVIFSSQRVPEHLHHDVLTWGVLGALVTRGAFILAGAALLGRFHWVLYVFGGFLVWTGWHLLRTPEGPRPMRSGRFLEAVQRVLPVAASYGQGGFLLREEGRWRVSPLLLALITVEATDVLFALDSVPAVFGVTRDVFVAYTSNILAVVGIRALYFVLAAATARFAHLHRGIAWILLLIGARMLLEPLVRLPEAVVLVAVAGILGWAIWCSLASQPGR